MRTDSTTRNPICVFGLCRLSRAHFSLACNSSYTVMSEGLVQEWARCTSIHMEFHPNKQIGRF